MPMSRRAAMRVRAVACILAGAIAALACEGGVDRLARTIQGGQMPDELPRRLNNPFVYPRRLYEQKIQGNVVLRLYIDTTGHVLPESTQVVESSGYPAFDSAAVRGSEKLEFTPARRGGAAIPLSVRHPVYFRRPDAPPLPGDTILRDTNSTDRP